MSTKYLRCYTELIVCTFIALVTGILIGCLDTVFGRTLLSISAFRSHHIYILVPFLPLAGIFILFIYKKFSPKAGKGMTLIFNAGFNTDEEIPLLLIPLVMFSTWITHLFGGSAGREGVAVQLGGTLSHAISRKLKLSKFLPHYDSRSFLIIGMAAGFAGLFQTPVAASFFAMEVLVAGSLQYHTLLPVFTASFAASYTSHLLGLEKFSVNLSSINLSLSTSVIIKLVIIGICFGIVGGLFAHFLALGKKYTGSWEMHPYLKIFIMGCCLSVLLLLIWNGRYCGLGTNLIDASFKGEKVYAYDWLLKLLLTLLTLSAGYQGGEVTPLFSIGATLGVFLAQLLGLPLALTAALGYAAVFGSATNTLLAPVFIGIEVFGPQFALFFVIVCMLSYVFNGNKTIYSAQQKYTVHL